MSEKQPPIVFTERNGRSKVAGSADQQRDWRPAYPSCLDITIVRRSHPFRENLMWACNARTKGGDVEDDRGLYLGGARISSSCSKCSVSLYEQHERLRPNGREHRRRKGHCRTITKKGSIVRDRNLVWRRRHRPRDSADSRTGRSFFLASSGGHAFMTNGSPFNQSAARIAPRSAFGENPSANRARSSTWWAPPNSVTKLPMASVRLVKPLPSPAERALSTKRGQSNKRVACKLRALGWEPLYPYFEAG